MSFKCWLASACALSALVVPASAVAGPGNGSVPPDGGVSAAPCVALKATPPVQHVNRKAAVTLKYNLTNCSDSDQAVSVSIAGTLETTAADGTVATCQAAAWDAGTLLLKPHATTNVDTQVPSSECSLGPDGGTFTFEATAFDPADSAPLATESSQVFVRLAF